MNASRCRKEGSVSYCEGLDPEEECPYRDAYARKCWIEGWYREERERTEAISTEQNECEGGESLRILRAENHKLRSDQKRAVSILTTGNIEGIDLEKDSELIVAIYQLIAAFKEMRQLRT